MVDNASGTANTADPTIDAQTSESSRMQLSTATMYNPGLKNFLLYSPLPATYPTYKAIGTDPTVGIAMDYILASITAAGETVEAEEDTPEEITEFIQSQWDALKGQGLSLAMRDIYRFGFATFEKVWSIDDNNFAICRLKQLEVQITGLLVEPHRGSLQGVVQPLVLGMANSPAVGWPVMLDMDHAVVFSWLPEGSQWYGTSTFERIRAAYNDYQNANEGCQRYDQYISGAHWCVYYPDGQTVQLDGMTVSSAVAASSLLESLESSGAITIPVPMQSVVAGLDIQTNGGWKVEIISDSTPRQPSYGERMSFLDVRKIRGLGLTERSLFESSSGTRADAGTHTDVVLSILEWRHAWAISEFNKQVIDQLLRQNFGPEWVGKVQIRANPIQKDSMSVAAEVYKAIIGGEGSKEAAEIDMPALRNMLEIPSLDADHAKDGENQTGNADPAIIEKADGYDMAKGVVRVEPVAVASTGV